MCVCLCAQLLLVVGWQCLLSVSDYCSIADSSGCLRNWPLIPVEANVLKYYNVELGWYMHLMLKHPLGESLWCWVLGKVVDSWLTAGDHQQQRQEVNEQRQQDRQPCHSAVSTAAISHNITHVVCVPFLSCVVVVCMCCTGLGLQDNGTMGAHHLATVALVVMSYLLNVHLLGETHRDG